MCEGLQPFPSARNMSELAQTQPYDGLFRLLQHDHSVQFLSNVARMKRIKGEHKNGGCSDRANVDQVCVGICNRCCMVMMSRLVEVHRISNRCQSGNVLDALSRRVLDRWWTFSVKGCVVRRV